MSQKNGSTRRFFEDWSQLELGLLGVILVLVVTGVAITLLLGRMLLNSPTEAGDAITGLPPGATEEATAEAATDETGLPVIELSPTVGSAGSTVTVRGEGWPDGSRVVIYLVPSEPPRYAVNSVIVDPDGTFAIDIIVPSDPRWLSESPVPVLALTDDERISSQAMLSISGPVDLPQEAPTTEPTTEPTVEPTTQPSGAGPTATPRQPTATPTANPTIVPTRVPAPIPAPPVGAGVAQLAVNANLNVRAGPGTNYPILGVLLYGQKAEIIGRNPQGDWWQVRFAGTYNDHGWVSAAYATAVNISNVPIVYAPPPPPPPPAKPTATPPP
ncbi:MAG TPA: SH3 domain-containing protein, partial [Anaerolineae bacterium]|nr:SH3 domain-containing protein [Anaerolineae bacterium]